MIEKIAIDWRLNGPRYRLEAKLCPQCGATMFPPRDICPVCHYPRPMSEEGDAYFIAQPATERVHRYAEPEAALLPR